MHTSESNRGSKKGKKACLRVCGRFSTLLINHGKHFSLISFNTTRQTRSISLKRICVNNQLARLMDSNEWWPITIVSESLAQNLVYKPWNPIKSCDLSAS